MEGKNKVREGERVFLEPFEHFGSFWKSEYGVDGKSGQTQNLFTSSSLTHKRLYSYIIVMSKYVIREEWYLQRTNCCRFCYNHPTSFFSSPRKPSSQSQGVFSLVNGQLYNYSVISV